jgi:hypothetical protein
MNQQNNQQNNQQKIDICIPRVDKTITKLQVIEYFKKLKIGYITNIIENPLKREPTGKRIVIKVNWNNTPTAIYMQTQLSTNQPLFMTYQFPFYWRLVENKPLIPL